MELPIWGLKKAFGLEGTMVDGMGTGRLMVASKEGSNKGREGATAWVAAFPQRHRTLLS